jgi:hypothetical protein
MMTLVFFSHNLFIKSVLAVGTLFPLILCFFKVVYGRVSDPDPDPHGSALIWAVGSGSAYKLRIRIRIQEGKNDPKKYKKGQNFHLLKCWMYSFEG